MPYSSSSMPAPERGGGAQPQPYREPEGPPSPGPAIVPPKVPEKRRLAPWGIFLAAVVLLGGLGYYWQTAKATGGGPTIQVSTTAVNAGSVVATIRVNGTIAAKERYNILAPRIQGNRSDVNRGGSANMGGGGGGGGRQGGGGGGMQAGFGGGGPSSDFQLILLRLAKAGTRVKAGEVVAEFDPQMQIQRLDDYKDQLVQTDAQIKAQYATLAAQREQNYQSLRSAKASWESALEDLKAKEVKAAIDQELADLAAEEAKATYDQLLFQDSLVDQQQQSQIRRTQLNRDQSRLEQARSEANLAKMTIKSPADGIVVLASTVRNNEFGQVREGDDVRSGQPFMFIVDPRAMILNASVNQVDAEKLRLGMKARIRLDAYSDIEVGGTLEGIGAMSKTSTFRAGYVGEIPVRIRLDQMDVRIIPDLTASAEIALATEQNALVLPRSAVFNEDKGKYVYVRGPEGWIRKPVDLGLSSFTAVAVKSGLQKGDVVALQRPM
jgi:HlyD family secretion protein